MSITSGFFNSVNHDRLYDAEQISSIFDGIIEDGVYESIGEAFMVKGYSESNDTVIVGTGRAWFDHVWVLNDSEYSIKLDPPNALLSRIDTIVIDIDRSDNVRASTIKVVTGTYAEEPIPPTLLKEELHKQYPIANVEVSFGTSAVIPDRKITYRVGTDDCPLVTGPLQAFNIENYFSQMEDEFYYWFDGIKDILDENVAANLQSQIDELRKNQTVTENGEIGDYVIPFTKEVMASIQNGGVNCKAESSVLTRPTLDITGSHVSSSGYIVTSGPYNQGFILPDGYICNAEAIFIESRDYGQFPVYFSVILTSPEGVATRTTSSACPTYSNTDGSVRGSFSDSKITAIDADSYPVSFVLTSLSGLLYKRTSSNVYGTKQTFACVHSVVTISKDHVVSVNPVLGKKTISGSIDTISGNSYTGPMCDTPAYLPDGSIVYASFCSDSIMKVAIQKVDQYGVYSNNSSDDASSDMYVDYNNPNTFIAFHDSDTTELAFRCKRSSAANYNDKLFIIDKSTLNISEVRTVGENYVIPERTFPANGTLTSLSNSTIKSNTYNSTNSMVTADSGNYNPFIMYDFGVSTVTSASVFYKYEIGSSIIGFLFNTGNNCRAVISGKNNIGTYASSFPQTFDGSANFSPEKCIRNAYRVRQIGDVVYMLFDSDTTEDHTGIGVGTHVSNLILLKIWYSEEG